MVGELNLNDCVTFVGEVSRDELPRYYAAADIFVHPNRVDGADVEGFGMVFLEAAAAGLPTIGGASGGVPEAVEDGQTGFLVRGTDATELAATIRTLAESPEMRRRLGAAGRMRVRRQFNWDDATARLSAVHDDVSGWGTVRPGWRHKNRRVAASVSSAWRDETRGDVDHGR
jgi:phosphatidylinositol alpha-1,6-mannosyltransferase